MTDLTATTPLCSIADADIYFDPANNHLYVDEWWATGSGVKASHLVAYPTPNASFIITAKNYGVDGNLISIEVDEKEEFGPDLLVSGGEITVYAEVGTTTLEDVITLLEAESDFTDIAAVTPAEGATATSGLVGTYGQHFLQGGVDPDASTSGFKAGALAFATRKINNLPFKGMRVSPTQDNAFPRQYELDDGTTVIETEVPMNVRRACAEEALAILKYGNTTRYKLQAQGVSGFGFGNQGLRESFVGNKEGDILSGECLNMLRPYMRRNWIMLR